MVERDFDGLKLAQRHEIDYVALSFVRSGEDLRTVKKEMARYKIKGKIVAKIETRKALENLDEVIAESGAVMVARGDLGVETPIQEVPFYQKMIIEKCIEKGIPVITATQMLQSMVNSPNPTRAEVSDVANATYDLTDAVMLSGESASGQYPLEAVSMMKKVASFNEIKNLEDHRKWFKFNIDDTEGVFCNNAYELYLLYRTQKKPVSGFIIFSHTGRTVRLLSRYRPLVPIFAFTPDKNVSESLSLSFGVMPFIYRQMAKKSAVNKQDIRELIDNLKKKGLVKEDSLLIVLHGDFWAIKGQTSTLRLMEV
jgi:pyruvate kinase